MQHQALNTLRPAAFSLPSGVKLQKSISNRLSISRREKSSLVVRADFNDFINSVTEAIQKSPLAEGKKALAKLQAGDYDETAVKAQVDTYISEPVFMFSFSTCPFCKKAKAVLDKAGVKYTAIELNEMGSQGMAIRSELAQRTGRTSMPNIFIGGVGVGGCNDGPGIMTLQSNGELIPMLQKAGAL